MELTRSVIKFSSNEWIVINNLLSFNLNIGNALTNYLARTNKPNIEDFCSYLREKDPLNIHAYSEAHFVKVFGKPSKEFEI